MVERVKLEPTMEEIVVALRETRQGAGRAPFTVVGQQSANWASGAAARGRGTNHDEAYSTDLAELRDAEIERLLTENARLNERVVFLLKVIEREQARSAILVAERTAIESERAVGRDVKAAVQAEVRPMLLVLLRLLEKQQRADPARHGLPAARREAGRPAKPAAATAEGTVAPKRETESDSDAADAKQPAAAQPN